MRVLSPRSLRTRLVIWNTAAIVVLFLGIGFLLRSIIDNALVNSVDRELFFRTNRFMDGGPRNGGGDGPGMGPGEDRAPEQRNPEGARPGIDGYVNNPPENGQSGQEDIGGQNLNHRPQGEGPSRKPARRQTPLADEKAAIATSDDTNATNLDLRPRLFDRKMKSLAPFGTDEPIDKDALSEALYKRTTKLSFAIWNGVRVRLLSRPFPASGELRGVVQAPYPMEDTERAAGDVNRALIYMFPVALLGAIWAGWALTGRVLRPVSNIVRTADELGANDLSRRLEIVGQDEFALLSYSLNALLGRLQLSFEEQQQLVERLERVVEQQRRFTADASHELKTPLTVIQANTSLSLSMQPSIEDYHNAMEEIDEAARIMSRLVNDLLVLARADSNLLASDRIKLDIGKLLGRAVAVTCLKSDRSGAEIQVDPDVELWGNEDEIYRVFVNLLGNACRYTPQDSMISVTASKVETGLEICFVDNGPGVPQKDIAHLGERFYRVNDSRTRSEGGSGLGLSICKEIVGAHGGTMTIESKLRVGTTVTLHFPVQ